MRFKYVNFASRIAKNVGLKERNILSKPENLSLKFLTRMSHAERNNQTKP